IEQAQSLAFAASQPGVPLDEVSRDLERLSLDALDLDQPDLAETANAAKAALVNASGDDDRTRAVRQELAGVLTDFVATASEPVALMSTFEPISLDLKPSGMMP